MEIENEILEKANHCLNCPTKPCSNACPMNTDIPSFISEIKNNDLQKAYNVLTENNVFSHICSIICPQEQQCEGSCVRGIKQEPTEIGALEEYVNNWAEQNSIKPNIQIQEEKDQSIAVVGAGPAGLQCAYDLRKKGYDVTVFEREDEIGGILSYGIPTFRLNKKYLGEITNMLSNMGIVFKTGKELGKDIHIKDLKKQFDYIFIGIGADTPSVYYLGEFDKIYEPDIFLRRFNTGDYVENLGDVVIIGGGNVAMDCARAAIRMGATSSTLVYRRNEKYMPASKSELKAALKDGVKKEFNARVISAHGKDREIYYLKCIKTEIINGKAVDIPGSEFGFKADTVVFAIGQKPNGKVLETEGLKCNESGFLVVDENGKTNIENVYAGGDLSNTKATVCMALGSARRAAKSIDREITNKM